MYRTDSVIRKATPRHDAGPSPATVYVQAVFAYNILMNGPT